MTVKPWVTTVLKSFVIFLLIFIIATLVIFFKGMNDRITSLEQVPFGGIVEVEVTPTPTATPSATIKPVRRVIPSVVPSK